MLTIPNILTLLRILFIPLIVWLYFSSWSFGQPMAAAVFTLAAITDWFDGYLARKWNQNTAFGAFLDPVADKLIVAVTLVVLVDAFQNLWLTLPAAVIISREIVISALREWMAQLGKRANVAVSMIGKVKTTLQMIAIGVLLFFKVPNFEQINWLDFQQVAALFGVGLLQAAALLTLWSMIVYLRAAWPILKGE